MLRSGEQSSGWQQLAAVKAQATPKPAKTKMLSRTHSLHGSGIEAESHQPILAC